MEPWRIEYFEALAQVGPVLLLAFVLEAGFHRDREVNQFRDFARASGMVLSVALEVAVLGALAGGFPLNRMWGLLGGAVVLQACAFLVLALAGGYRIRVGEAVRIAPSTYAAGAFFLGSWVAFAASFF